MGQPVPAPKAVTSAPPTPGWFNTPWPTEREENTDANLLQIKRSDHQLFVGAFLLFIAKARPRPAPLTPHQRGCPLAGGRGPGPLAPIGGSSRGRSRSVACGRILPRSVQLRAEHQHQGILAGGKEPGGNEGPWQGTGWGRPVARKWEPGWCAGGSRGETRAACGPSRLRYQFLNGQVETAPLPLRVETAKEKKVHSVLRAHYLAGNVKLVFIKHLLYTFRRIISIAL